MIKKPVSYYINKANKNNQDKILVENSNNQEDRKHDTANNIQNNNIEITVLEKIDKKLSKYSYEEKIIYLKEKINEIKAKSGNNSRLLFDIISKLIALQLTTGDLAFNKGDYNDSLEKYKECLQLNEPLPASEWSKYPEWYGQRIIIYNSIASAYEKLNKKEQAIEYIKLSFNVQEKYNINTEFKSKYNDIIFLTGKQSILLGNYKEALKYLLKVEKNIYNEYNIEKILKKGKIDDNLDKKFLKDNPDEYIYLLNLIYKCYIKQKDYDLGEKFYQRYEEMYSILTKIKQIKYPFKGIDENSDEEIINFQEKINDEEKKSKSKFYKQINENILVNNNSMIDKAEDRFKILPPIIKKRETNSESKGIKKENEVNYNKEYINNYKELSWGKEKEENQSSKKIIKMNKTRNSTKIPLPKKTNKIKKINLSIIKDSGNNNKSNINNRVVNLDNSINKLSKTKTISEEKSKKNSVKISIPSPKFVNDKKKNIKNENLKQTIKEGKFYPPYDFVFKKPEKYNISKDIPKLVQKKKKKITDNLFKNPVLPKISQKLVTEVNDLKKDNNNYKSNINLNRKSNLSSLKRRSSSSKIENINRFVRIEEKLKMIEKNLIEKKDINNKEVSKINEDHNIKNNQKKKKMSKNVVLFNIKGEKNIKYKNKSSFALPSVETNNITKNRKREIKNKTSKIGNAKLIQIKNLKLPSQKKRKFSDNFNNKEERDNSSKSSKNEHEEIKSLGSFISFGKKEEKFKKEKKIKRNEKKSKTKVKSIPIFKPAKMEIDNNKNSKEAQKNNNKINKEGKLRFKSFQELIIKFFKKANLIISSENVATNQNKKFNKYEKIYKKYEKNHMILNKIINNYIYTITMYIPVLNINENIKNDEKKSKKNSPFLETQITYKRNDSVFFNKYKINLPIIEENDFYNEELKEKIIDTLLNSKLNINFAWIIFLYYFENYFSTYKLDLENRARGIVNTNDTLFDEKNIGKNIFNINKEEDKNFIDIQKDYIYYFVNIINKNLYNITQWKNKKILIGKKIDENESFCNLYYNILHKYINIFSDFLYLEDTLTNKKVVIRNLEIESIKNRNQIILDSIQNIVNYSYDFKLLSQRLLLKKLFYNSFINTDLIKISNENKSNNIDNDIIDNNKENENIYIKKENQKMPLIDSLDLIKKFKNIEIEQYFYDNQIIYKGIIKMEKYDYMYLAISVRLFEKIILNQTKIKIVDYNILNLNARNTNVDIDNLHFLSNDKDIVKLYPKLNIDLTLKFYDITEYKSFLQLTLINLNPNSKWYDITYMPWEMYNYFISLLEDEHNRKYFLGDKFSIEEIAKTQKMDSELGVLFYYFISNFCEIENGSLMIKKYLYKEDLYWKFFMKLYNIYDNYVYGLMLSEKYINNNIVAIPIEVKLFYQNFLSKIHNYYYKLYFKENKYYIPEKIESNIDSDDEEFINSNKPKSKIKQKNKNKKNKENQNKNLFIIKKGYKDNYKSVFEKEEGNLSLTFNLYLKLGKNKYNAIFKFLKNRIYITNDPENIKNYLLPIDYLPKVFIQLRSILSNELIQTNIYNIDLINNIKYMFDNNTNEKLLKTYFENLIHIADLPYGKKIIFDFLYNSFSLKSKSKNIFKENNLSILNKLSLILLHESNYNSSQIPENIILVKRYKTLFINTKKSLKMLFNFRIYGDRQKTLETKKKDEITNDKESLYIKTFGRIKKSKISEKLDKKFGEMQSKQIDYFKEMFYYYLISVYFPKTSIKSLFILSTYDLQIILKKIKNQKIREEYLTTVDNFIRLIPNKISLQNTPTGQKIYINFSKYTELRTDWEKQLPMKSQKNKLLFEKKLNYIIDKKSQLKIFLKTNFVNLRTKDSLYDISTDEMVLAIKKIKIYEINDIKLSCIVSIYYHKILDYWQIFLFFPFSARKFVTIFEPKHMENIYTDENLSQINKKEIKDKEIYEFIIDKSKISYNFEEIAYLEILNMKLLLKELLYYGFELINDGLQSELNKVIYIEITIKSLNLFTLDRIEKIIDKVEIDQCYLIFQSFSFHELYWHKENFKLEDLAPYYSKNIILEKKITKSNENIAKKISIENNNENHKKLLPFCYLRKLINHIIQPYVNSQQHIFEKQMKLFKNKSIIGGDLQKIINSTKYDRANQQKIANLYQQKLDNKIIFNKIYTETIRSDPPVIASIGINLVKEKIIITLYYPFKSKSYDIEIDFDTVKKSFFPYFLDLLSIDKVNLGKRILKRYQNFITKTPHFLKLFQPSN